MKKLHFLIVVVGVLLLISTVAFSVGPSELKKAAGKETPKQTVAPAGKSAVQQPAEAVQHDPAKCAEKHATGKCQGHPPGGCDPANCPGHPPGGCDPSNCAGKHAGGQGQGHPPGNCQKASTKK